MRSITAYLLSTSLLILATACDRLQTQTAAVQTASPIERIDGKHIEEMVRQSDKAYVLVNFYATYCKPCIKELPELIRMKNDPEAEVEVLFVSLDEPEDLESKLAGFLTKHHMNFSSFHCDPGEAETFLRKVHPNWNRSIPLNIIYSNTGRIIEITGMTDPQEVAMIISKDRSFR